MEVVRHADVGAFAARAGDVLLADEARHNVMLGLLATLVRDPGFYESYTAWTVEHRGSVVGAASITPPFNLLLARPGHPVSSRRSRRRWRPRGSSCRA